MNTTEPAIPRTKVCGVTRRQDLELLASAGVDCVGLNFVPTSPRCVSLALGRELSEAAAGLGLQRAAVVMNMAGQEIVELLRVVPLDFLQLHGEELPSLLDAFDLRVPIVKAISWSGRDKESELAEAWADVPELAAFLVDAFAPGVGGGTGKQARWDLLTPRPAPLAAKPLLLAGGLNPGNVAEAIAAISPAGVDTASGVESTAGIKDGQRVREFAANAIAALNS